LNLRRRDCSKPCHAGGNLHQLKNLGRLLLLTTTSSSNTS
jgi:hypothetical protein